MANKITTMKVGIIILIGIFISPCLIGQNTKLVVKNFQNSKQILEEYYALTDNENIKHGEYIQYYRTSNKDFPNLKESYMSKKGYYFQNQPDSLWTFFNSPGNGHIILKEEKYSRGRKTGIWKTYIENGTVIKRFDYDLNKEIDPEIRINARYPAIAAEMGIQGIVKVRVIYNNDCTITGISIVKSAAPVLDDDAIKYVSNIENLKLKYSLLKDCSTKRDSTYTVTYKLNDK